MASRKISSYLRPSPGFFGVLAVLFHAPGYTLLQSGAQVSFICFVKYFSLQPAHTPVICHKRAFQTWRIKPSNQGPDPIKSEAQTKRCSEERDRDISEQHVLLPETIFRNWLL